MATAKQGSRAELQREFAELQGRVRELEAREARSRVNEEILQASEDRFSAVVSSTVDAVIIIDAEGKVTFWSGGAARMFGRSSSEMLGLPLTSIMPERYRAQHARSLRRVTETGDFRLAETSIEVSGLREDDTEFPVELTLSTWSTQAQRYYSGIIRDISERKVLEERLKQQALSDVLTGLPNRLLLFDRLNYAISQAKRNDDLLALLYIDLDKFKSINDTMGHAAGDLVLRETASRISSCLRKSDTVARMGGDEFTVVLPRVQRPKGAAMVASKIIRAMRAPFQIATTACHVDASIGITLCPNDGSTAETLLKNADEAMYLAKRQEKERLHFFAEP